MRVTLHEVGKGRALPTTSLEFHTGAVRYALAETEQRPTVLGLIASGRMRPDTGRVTIDGATDNRMLRRTIALVDAPDVSDPHADITLAGVVGEELMFAGRRATPLHARRWLNEIGFGELAGVPIGNVDPAARVRILCELAVLREGTRGIVLVSPDRHGGSPDGWWRIASEFADRGYAMLVILGGSAAVALERMQEIDAVNASGPIDPLVLDTEADSSTDATDGSADTDDPHPHDVDTDARPNAGVSPGIRNGIVHPSSELDSGLGLDSVDELARTDSDADTGSPDTDADTGSPDTDTGTGSPDTDADTGSAGTGTDVAHLHDDHTDARPNAGVSPGIRNGIVHPSSELGSVDELAYTDTGSRPNPAHLHDHDTDARPGPGHLHDDHTDARPNDGVSPGIRDGIVHPSSDTYPEPDPTDPTDTDTDTDPDDADTTEKGAER